MLYTCVLEILKRNVPKNTKVQVVKTNLLSDYIIHRKLDKCIMFVLW